MARLKQKGSSSPLERRAPSVKMGKRKPISGTRYSQAERLDAVEFSKRVGVERAAEQLGISSKSIANWARSADPMRPRRSASRYSPSEKSRAIELANQLGTLAASERLGINRSTIAEWAPDAKRREYRRRTPEDQARILDAVQRLGASGASNETGFCLSVIYRVIDEEGLRPPPRKRNKYSNEERQSAMALARKEGSRKAASMLSMSENTLNRWIADSRGDAPKRVVRVYSPEFREAAMARAKQVGVKQTAKELSVTTVTIHGWIRKSIPPAERRRHRTHPEELRQEAIARVKEVGIVHAAVELDVNESTLAHWVRTASTEVRPKRPCKRSYDDETKAEVLAAVPTAGISKAAKQLGVPYAMARKWAIASGIKYRRTVGHHKNFDKSFLWMQHEYPALEQWRGMAVEWVGCQRTSISSKLTGLRRFLVDYVLPSGLADSPARFFSGTSTQAAFRTMLPNSKYGTTLHNEVVKFLDWVLARHFSTIDTAGRSLVQLGLANPFTRQSTADDPAHTESVYASLPYGYIDELRSMLAPGPNFTDWKWAHGALAIGSSANASRSTDWFAVEERQIDKSDPDCVFRTRLRSADLGGPVLEMWSPVRWVALLVKLILPLRTFQVRMLDSGESDTWRYMAGRWQRNDHPLREGTKKHPLAQGVLRRSISLALKPENWSQPPGPETLIYVNTNKTADAAKTGTRKGYSFPWPSGGPLHGNPFVWFEKLRAWQEKYNPIARRTSWTELDGRHIKAKSDPAIAGFVDSCFLFRCPEAGPGEEHLPIASGVLDSPWRALLVEFQRRLADRGETLPDGSPIRFVSPDGSAVDFPLHSLRVSLLTALAVEGEVPFPILQKIAGHSRLLMAIYYFKPGSQHMERVLHAGFQRLEANKDASIVRFLKSAEHDKLLDGVVANDETSFLSSMKCNPAARNAAGWMPMDIGLCLVGGNASPVEDMTGVGGCYNGGQCEGPPSSRKHGPVPGGSRNCCRCRWLATRPEHLPALVAKFNTIMYHFDEVRNACVESEKQLDQLKKDRMAAEDAGRLFERAKDLRDAERRWETNIQRFNGRAEDAAAVMRLIVRCQDALKKVVSGAMKSGALLATGSAVDVKLAIEEIDSELLQLSDVCEAAELYPDLDPGKAVFRRSQLLDAALLRDGMRPIFLTMGEHEQLAAGNAFVRRLAESCCPTDAAQGTLQVISMIDMRKSLKGHIGLDLFQSLGPSDEVAQTTPILLAEVS